jgi:hypothetical protein
MAADAFRGQPLPLPVIPYWSLGNFQQLPALVNNLCTAFRKAAAFAKTNSATFVSVFPDPLPE